MGAIICAWCGTRIGECKGCEDTHGICGPCRDKQQGEIDARKEARMGVVQCLRCGGYHDPIEPEETADRIQDHCPHCDQLTAHTK